MKTNPIELTIEIWETLKRVNQNWNDKIQYESDSKHYHKSDHWAFPVDGIGDCEDYAIAKRQALASFGINGVLATCWTETGGYHAVLVVHTDRGDFVLDNRYDRVYNFTDLPYKWHKIEGENGKWYEIL